MFQVDSAEIQPSNKNFRDPLYGTFKNKEAKYSFYFRWLSGLNYTGKKRNE